MTFDSFDFDRRIAAGIKACGYVSPTPIQFQAIPAVLAGNDVMGLAQTGTGKTAAFALPILQRIISGKRPKRVFPRTLVLAPTRELALQIHENFMSMGRKTGIKSAPVIGGAGFGPQIKAVRYSSVVVACPGRLLHLMEKDAVRLDKIDTLVLDEADRMLDMGFMPDIERIVAALPKQRQNLLFSATMPADIRKLANKILHEPKVVQVANTVTAADVDHAVYPVKNHLKTRLLGALLEELEHESLLIFTRTKHKAKNLANRLHEQGYKTTLLQGNMGQRQRQKALTGFKKGKFKIMVATDIAARGIDCDLISHVINYDMPDTVECYTHRIGRTGRAGRSGQAITFATPQDKSLMRQITKILKIQMDHHTLNGFNYEQPTPKPRGNGEGGKPHRFENKRRPSGGRDSFKKRSR